MPLIFNISNLYDSIIFIAITLCNNNTSNNYSSLVPYSLLPRSFSIPSSKYLRYAFALPPLCLRFINGGRSSSQRRMIEFTTKDERKMNERIRERERGKYDVYSKRRYSTIDTHIILIALSHISKHP